MIPSAEQKALSVILQQWPAWQIPGLVEVPELVRQLEGGLTNRSYLLRGGDRLVVLRINADNSEQLGLNRRLEANIWRSAATEGLAPVLHYADPKQRYMISEYLEHHLPLQADPEGLVRWARLLRRVHQLPAQGAVLNVAARAEHYWRGLLAAEAELLRPLLRCRNQLQRYFNKDPVDGSSTDLCLCHNDPVLANIIDSGEKLHLIDWEYAATGDPYFDLAVFAIHENLSEAARGTLLNAYLYSEDQPESRRGAGVENAAHRLESALARYRYLDLLWSALQGLAPVDLDAKLATLMADLPSR